MSVEAKRTEWITSELHVSVIYEVYLLTDSTAHSAALQANSLALSYTRKCPHFMEPEGSLPCSQQPATFPTPQPYSVHAFLSCIFKIHLILYSHLRLGLQAVPIFHISPPKSCVYFSFPPYAPHSPLI